MQGGKSTKSRKQNIAKKQNLGVWGEKGKEEKQKACAFTSIASDSQKCILLGVPGGESYDCAELLFIAVRPWCKLHNSLCCIYPSSLLKHIGDFPFAALQMLWMPLKFSDSREW